MATGSDGGQAAAASTPVLSQTEEPAAADDAATLPAAVMPPPSLSLLDILPHVRIVPQRTTCLGLSHATPPPTDV